LTNSAQKSRKFWHLSPIASLVFSPDGLGFYILYLYHIFKKMVLDVSAESGEVGIISYL